MEAWVLNKKYEKIGICDVFQSFIWTERYNQTGDFELYLPATDANISLFLLGDYVSIRNSKVYMIIETIELTSDAENGNFLTISGRSLESILDRRIIWNQTIFDGNFQDFVLRILNENIITPSDKARIIPDFIFQKSNDPLVTKAVIAAQYRGETVYDVIQIACEERQLGMRILPYKEGGFLFELYVGVDYSYAQSERPWIVFSPNFDNLLESNFLESTKVYKNVTLCAGEGEGSDRKVVEVKLDESSGLDRKETFTEANGISTNVDGTEVSPESYLAQLHEKGKEALLEFPMIKSFDGVIDSTQQFVYGTDFSIGDIVQIRNEYGKEAVSRITELVRSHNVEGESAIPTFTTIL